METTPQTPISAPSNVEAQKPRAKRVWPWIILGSILFLGVFIYFLPSILGIFFRDIGPIDDSDLKLSIVTVPDDQNAYFDLMKMSKVIAQGPSKINDIVEGKAWDEQAVADILQKNTEALAYFESASQKLFYQNPSVADPANLSPNLILPPVNSFRQMSDISAVESLLLHKQGRTEEAIEEAFRTASIGQKMQDSQAPLIEYLVAFAIKGRALRTMQMILQDSRIDSQTLNAYIARLEQFYENEEAMATAFKAEYWGMHAWLINAITSKDSEMVRALREEFGDDFGGVSDSYHFRPNKTKLLFAELARAQVRDSKRHCGELELLKFEPLLPSGEGWMVVAQQYVTENMAGKAIRDIVAGVFGSVQLKRCKEDYLVASTQTLMAIKAFKNDTKAYPASLEELVPKYLSKVPVDPFDGAPLKYDANSKTIYSSGEKLRESGDERYKSLGELKLQIAF